LNPVPNKYIGDKVLSEENEKERKMREWKRKIDKGLAKTVHKETRRTAE
jgi:hypothetical protein